MRAIRKFKSLLGPKRVAPPFRDPARHLDGADDSSSTLHPSLAAEDSVKQDLTDTPSAISTEDEVARIIRERQEFLKAHGGRPGIKSKLAKQVVGQAYDITTSTTLHLGIGTGAVDDFAGDQQPPADFVSDSPSAVDFNIYDRAFDAEVERIKRSTSRKGSGRGGPGGGGVEVYHTRFNSYGERHYKTTEGGGEGMKVVDGDKTPRSEQELGQQGQRFADLAAQLIEAKNKENNVAAGLVEQESQ